MKNIFASLLIAAALSAPAAYAQKAGDSVTPDALGKLEWIQGEAPKSWEPGKLYVLECWATWCGPCLAAIPHVDALYDKYQEKGLRVIGVNVWEDGKETVEKFVKNKGDGMSYPVAYTGKGGVFETEWLKPAGVQGIPHAFLVKDGKVIATTHPAQLTDEVVEKLLEGGDAEKGALDAMNQKQMKQAALSSAMTNFSKASVAKDLAGMETALEELKKVQPDNLYIPFFTNDLNIAKGNWAAVEKALEEPGEEKMRPAVIGAISRSVSKREGVPAETINKVISTYETALAAAKKGPVDAVYLSRLYWNAGNKDKALAEADSTVEIMKARASEAPGLSPAPFEKFAAAVHSGAMPSDEEFTGWLRDSMIARAATAEKPATPATPVKPVETKE